MRDIGSANVQGTLYDLLSPRVVGDYIENIGAACQNPDGYAANKIFVAYDSSMNQHLYKTTAQITQGTQITSSNCEQTSLSELLSGSGSSSSLEDLSDTDISSKTAGDIVEYNHSTGKWENTQKLVNLEKSIAPVEDGATLSQAYAIGEKFIRGGVRYKAKTDLASGTQFSSLIINTNYEAADDVSSEIQTLTHKTENIDDVISENGAKNLLPINLATLKAQNTASGSSWNGNTYTWRNVSYTLNDDGTISVVTSGTTTLSSQLNIVVNNSDDIAHLVGKNVALSGCPSGGTSGTYCIRYNDSNGNQYETGNGISINSLPANAKLYIAVEAGANYPTPKVFKPMITLASQPNSDYAHYVPYAMTNRELTDETAVKILTPTLNSSYFDNTATASCYQMGKLVMINLAATTIAEIPNGNVDLTTDANLPAPIDGNAIRGFMWNNGTKAILGQLRIDGNKLNFPFNTAVPSGTSIRINFSYFAQ